MNPLFVLAVLAAAYLLYVSGYPLFAAVVAVAIVLMLATETLQEASKAAQKSGKKQKAPVTKVVVTLKKKEQPANEKAFLAIGALFNFIGKSIYRLLNGRKGS